MNQEISIADEEFAAMQTIYSALKLLDAEAQKRVLNYMMARLDIPAPKTKVKEVGDGGNAVEDGAEEQVDESGPFLAPAAFKTFAELFDAADPQTTAHKALLAGCWLQVCQGADSFDGHGANKELNHLGHRIPNITNALAALNGQKPSLAIQLKKSGTSQQARKTYKITSAGEGAVRAMLNG